MKYNSIRWKLSLSFAGIALLTALALGLALLAPMRAYYRDQERAYLEGNAVSIALGLAPLYGNDQARPEDLEAHIRFLSFLAQARVRLVDMQEKLIADSGSPNLAGMVKMAALGGGDPQMAVSGTSDLLVRIESDISLPGEDPFFGQVGASEVAPVPVPPIRAQGGAVEQSEVQAEGGGLRFFYSRREPDGGEVAYGVTSLPDRTLISVVPVSKTMYGFELFNGDVPRAVRSDQVLRVQVFGMNGTQVGWVELSEGPAYGRQIVDTVARGWALASLLAVIVAATAGWWISRRMSAPVTALTGVTRRMAGGDLSARANITQADEYGVLGRVFNEMAGRVEGTVLTLRRFAADAAHELHTPLTALRTNLELAQTTDDPREYLARVAEQVARLEHLTSELLDLSRIEGGSPEPEAVHLDLAQHVAHICEPFAAQAEQAGIDFRLEGTDEPVWVRGQQSRLAHAVQNLVENALKFTPPGGWVAVRLAVEGERAVLRVEDSGIGIQADDLPALFQRFHRGRNATGYPGSGLGLSIVKAVADAHGGAVRAESEPGRTRFILELPKAEE